MKRYGWLLMLLLPALLCGAELKHLFTDASAYPLLKSTVLALDDSGQPLSGLASSNFELSFGGQPVDSLAIRGFGETGQALSLLVCVDVSNTMNGEPLNSLKQALRELVNAKRAEDEYALAVFAGDWTLLTDFSTEKELLLSRINELNARPGSTAMYYGAYKSLEQIKRTAANPFKAMLLFGDGKDENQTDAYAEKDVISYSAEHQIPIFTVGYTRVDRQYLQALEHLARVCGGSYAFAANASELSASFNKISAQLLQSVVLSYLPLGLAGDGAAHKLSLILKSSAGNSTTNAEVRIPSGRAAHQGTDLKFKTARKYWKYAILILLAGLVVLGIWLKIVYWPRKKARQTPPVPEPKAAPVKARTQAPLAPERERTMILTPGAKPTPSVKEAGLRLEILIGPEAGKRYSINPPGATIGRAADNDIVLNDDTVSGHHARVSFVNGQYVVEEVKATNGMFINGIKTTRAIITGNTTFKFGATEGAFSLI